MTATLNQSHYNLLRLAWANGEWPGGKRWSSNIDNGIRHYLIEFAGGICAWCGETIESHETIELAHIFPQGPKRLGRIPGNLGAVHTLCNRADRDAPVALSAIVRPDLVPVVWPSTVDLRLLGERLLRDAVAVQHRRRVKRGIR